MPKSFILARNKLIALFGEKQTDYSVLKKEKKGRSPFAIHGK
jgi:hypothetical protein